jgi:uncharacterized Zn finger protein (UPF0148 family)
MTDVCRNSGRDDYWTCPGCYADLFGVGTGTHTCPTCEREIECEIEMEPVCVARLKVDDGEED